MLSSAYRFLIQMFVFFSISPRKFPVLIIKYVNILLFDTLLDPFTYLP